MRNTTKRENCVRPIFFFLWREWRRISGQDALQTLSSSLSTCSSWLLHQRHITHRICFEEVAHSVNELFAEFGEWQRTDLQLRTPSITLVANPGLKNMMRDFVFEHTRKFQMTTGVTSDTKSNARALRKSFVLAFPWNFGFSQSNN